MTSTIDAGGALTSLSQSPAERCRRLLSRGRPPERRNTLLLAALAVLLPALAVALGSHDLKDGVFFVACVGLAALVLSRPALGGWLLVGLVPVTSGLAPGFPVKNVRVSEALIGLVGLTLLIGTRRRVALRWGPLEWLLAGWGLAWAVLGAADAVTLRQHLTLSEWGTVVGQLQFFLLYRAVRISLRERRDRVVGLVVLFVAAVPVTLIAMLQEASVGGTRATLSKVTGGVSPLQPHGVIRATALFGNWAALAGYLMPLLLVLVALALGGQLRRHRRAAVALTGLMMIGLLLPAEISVIACTVPAVIYLGARYGVLGKTVRGIAVGAIVCAVVLAPVVVSRYDQQFGQAAGSSRSAIQPQTLQFREKVWAEQYLPAIAQRPLTGWGIPLPATVRWPYPESQYIAILIGGGYPLLVVYLLLLWGMFDQARRAARSRDPMEQALGRALVASVFSLLLLGAIWPFFSNGGLPQVLWCLFALATPAVSRTVDTPGRAASRVADDPRPPADPVGRTVPLAPTVP
jgi:hypothetical protein